VNSGLRDNILKNKTDYNQRSQSGNKVSFHVDTIDEEMSKNRKALYQTPVPPEKSVKRS
jgi:hypothetical protein